MDGRAPHAQTHNYRHKVCRSKLSSTRLLVIKHTHPARHRRGYPCLGGAAILGAELLSQRGNLRTTR